MIRDILAPLNTTGKTKKITIGHTYPHGVSRQYTADMRKIVSALAEEIKREVMPLVREDLSSNQVRSDIAEELLSCEWEIHTDKLERFDSELRFDSYNYELPKSSNSRLDSLSDSLAAIRRIAQNIVPGLGLATEYARKTYQANERNLSRGIERSLGVEVNLPEGSTDLLTDWIEENELYIEDLQEEYLKRIQKAVSNGYTKNLRYSEVAKDIQKATGITWRRAQHIAVDQIGTLNGLVTRERNEELGISKAIWRTMRDEKVRGNPGGLYPNARPSHWARDGEEFSWNEGIDGELPGTPNRCRCFGESIIEF